MDRDYREAEQQVDKELQEIIELVAAHLNKKGIHLDRICIIGFGMPAIGNYMFRGNTTEEKVLEILKDTVEQHDSRTVKH